jgi:hypothetical protein
MPFLSTEICKEVVNSWCPRIGSPGSKLQLCSCQLCEKYLNISSIKWRVMVPTHGLLLGNQYHAMPGSSTQYVVAIGIFPLNICAVYVPSPFCRESSIQDIESVKCRRKKSQLDTHDPLPSAALFLTSNGEVPSSCSDFGEHCFLSPRSEVVGKEATASSEN